jgi:hypothetical protein
LCQEIELCDLQDEGWMFAYARGFVESVAIVSTQNAPPPEALEASDHKYWDSPSQWLKGRLKITVTHPAWIAHLNRESAWGSTAFELVDDHDECPPVIPEDPAGSRKGELETQPERSDGFMPFPRSFFLGYHISPEFPDLVWCPRFGRRFYTGVDERNGIEIRQDRLREWVGRPVVCVRTDGEREVGILADAGEREIVLCFFRGCGVYGYESLASIGLAGFRKDLGRRPAPLTYDRAYYYHDPIVVSTRFAPDDPAKIILELQTPLASLQEGWRSAIRFESAAAALHLLTVPALENGELEGSSAKLAMSLMAVKEEHHLDWRSEVYVRAANGYILEFEMSAPNTTKFVELDDLYENGAEGRAALLKFLKEPAWPTYTIHIRVSDPAWLEHLEGVSPYLYSQESYGEIQDWSSEPATWNEDVANKVRSYGDGNEDEAIAED